MIKLGRILRITKFGLRYFWYKFFFGFKKLGWPIEFSGGLILFGTDLIEIGNNVVINEYASLKCVEENYTDSKDSRIVIGNEVGIGIGTNIVAAKKITIEDNVIIAPYCFIGDFDHEYKDPKIPIVKQALTNIQPVVIKQGTWIGTKVTVCAGVTIGKNSVIGANSVVTKDIPNFAVAVGSPARVIKLFDQKTKKWIKNK